MNKEVKWVEVRYEVDELWVKRIFVDVLNNGRCICVSRNTTEEDYKKGYGYNPVYWNMWREIKEPTYKPYTKLTEEVKSKLRGAWLRIKAVDEEYPTDGFSFGKIHLAHGEYTLEQLFQDWEFLDGTPIGELVE